MERRSALDSQSACYSSHKSRPTMKALVGVTVTPSGVLAYVSEFFSGSTSDKEITQKIRLLNQLLSGDKVMADQGFNIQDKLAVVAVSIFGCPCLFKRQNTVQCGRIYQEQSNSKFEDTY